MLWLGETGRQLRGDPEAQALACYLLTAPSSNMIGLYYLPVATMAHELGWDLEGASKGLRRVSEAGFARYDSESDFVWVVNMASWQLLVNAKPMKPDDNRAKGVRSLYELLQPNAFLGDFYDKYSHLLHLKERRAGPSEGASKGLTRGFEEASKQERREKGEALRYIEGSTVVHSSYDQDEPDLELDDIPFK